MKISLVELLRSTLSSSYVTYFYRIDIVTNQLLDFTHINWLSIKNRVRMSFFLIKVNMYLLILVRIDSENVVVVGVNTLLLLHIVCKFCNCLYSIQCRSSIVTRTGMASQNETNQ